MTTPHTTSIEKMTVQRQAAAILALRQQKMTIDQIAAKLLLPRDLVRAIASPPRYK